jgi:hypothetical protein
MTEMDARWSLKVKTYQGGEGRELAKDEVKPSEN